MHQEGRRRLWDWRAKHSESERLALPRKRDVGQESPRIFIRSWTYFWGRPKALGRDEKWESAVVRMSAGGVGGGFGPRSSFCLRGRPKTRFSTFDFCRERIKLLDIAEQ